MSTTDRTAFEQYALSQGCNDFEYDQDDSHRYRNPFTQREYKYWRAALDYQAATEAAKAEQQGEDKPVMYCVPDKSGKPLFGKGWMFSPIPQLAATMPLYTRPAAKATGTAGELPGMWEPADLVGGETDMPLAARQPAPVLSDEQIIELADPHLADHAGYWKGHFKTTDLVAFGRDLIAATHPSKG